MQSEVSHVAGRRHDCPQCGAPVPFRSSISIFAVCEHCRSTVVRRDFNVESFGTMAELPPDLSPLQVGTQGYWNGRGFTLIGRLRLHWGDGSWSEWCADFGNGTVGWIAEAMGFFMVSFAHTAPEAERFIDPPRGGTRVTLGGTQWLVIDVKETRCVAAEGELPFPMRLNAVRVGADLTGVRGQFGTLEITESGNSFFVGEYAQFEDLNFTNLRKVPGWEQDAEITRQRSEAVGCPQCGAPVNLRAEGLSMSAVCGSCGTIADTSKPVLRDIGKVSATTLKLKPILPIGTRGMLRGQPWEVIGYMKRKDRWCFWEEFLLFNPWLGFRYLVTYKGHWSLVRILPGHHTNHVWEGEHFAKFAQEEAKTTDVLGEFYWRVKVGERVLLTDYISPPRILSREQSQELNEITWSGGEYIDHDEVAQAFKARLPEPSGTYLNQPNPHQQHWREVRSTFIFLALGYVLIQILCLGFGAKTKVLNTGLTYQVDAVDKTLITEQFKLSGWSAPLNVTAYTNQLPLGTYLALKGALVNARTQQSIPLSLPMTTYAGLADLTHETTLPSVPGGTYYFRFEPDASPSVVTAGINLSASRGGIFWSNFFLGLIPVLFWPLWLKLRAASFEKQRWMESEYGGG
ncbi:MAG: DUF4178 domain-containing protein [Prosthecobacter sp.]